MTLIRAHDVQTGEKLYINKLYHSNTAGEAISVLQKGLSELSGWDVVLGLYGGHIVGIAVSSDGYQDATWQGDSGTPVIDIPMSKIQTVSTTDNVTAAQAALQEQQRELQAKTAMLQSPTAQFSNKDFYNSEVAETSAEIRAYNKDVAAFLATAPGQPGVTDDALLKKPTAQSQLSTAPAGDKSNGGKALVVVAGVAVGIIALAIAAGRD